MRKFIAGMVCGVLLTGGIAYAQTTKPDAESYLRWSELARLSFAAGFGNGFKSGGVAAAGFPDIYNRILACLDKWTFGQTEAIITQYVRANPAEWHKGMGLLAQGAIDAACR